MKNKDQAKRDLKVMTNSCPLICDLAMDARMIISNALSVFTVVGWSRVVSKGGDAVGRDFVVGKLGFDFF